jgi:membrane protease YdiL (CAAX protease family)
VSGDSLGYRIFIGPYGLRAGWRLVLFILVFAIAALAVSPAGFLLRSRLQIDVAPLVREVLGMVPVFLATWVMSRVDHRRFSSYGLGAANRFRNLAAGGACGFLAISVLIALLFVARSAEFHTPDLHGLLPIVSWGAYWMVFFIGVAFGEEMLTRGYPLYAVSEGIGFWPAAILFSLVFGLGHLGNRGESYAGIANAMVAGLMFAYSLKWTGSLWWAIGAHFAWDWGQTFFFGVADSGITARHHLLSVAPAGPAWLSGGATGPEGSVLALPVLLSLAAAVRFTAPRVGTPELERRPAPAPEPAGTLEPASPPSVSPSTYSVDSGDTN